MATSPDALPTVGVLRELFRYLQSWRSAAIEYGIDSLTGPDGTEYALVDIENLYALRRLLSGRQRQAIEACLVADQREVDVAIAMGVSPTNPVASYATQGMRRLLAIAAELRAEGGVLAVLEDTPRDPAMPEAFLSPSADGIAA